MRKFVVPARKMTNNKIDCLYPVLEPTALLNYRSLVIFEIVSRSLCIDYVDCVWILYNFRGLSLLCRVDYGALDADCSGDLSDYE